MVRTCWFNRTGTECTCSARENYQPYLSTHFSHNSQSTKSLHGFKGRSSHLKQRSQHDFVTKDGLNDANYTVFTPYLLFQFLVFGGFRPTCSSRLLTLQSKSYYLRGGRRREIVFRWHFLVMQSPIKKTGPTRVGRYALFPCTNFTAGHVLCCVSACVLVCARVRARVSHVIHVWVK